MERRIDQVGFWLDSAIANFLLSGGRIGLPVALGWGHLGAFVCVGVHALPIGVVWMYYEELKEAHPNTKFNTELFAAYLAYFSAQFQRESLPLQ